MKKLVWLILILATLLLTVACGSEVVTTSPDTANPPITTAETIFYTSEIKAITLYGQYGEGEGKKVPDEKLSEFTAWLKTFAIDKEANKPLPPGTNTYCLEIEYLDGTVVKTGLDAVEVAGNLYYVKHGEAPEWFGTILPEPFVTTKPKLVIYPDSYAAELGSVQSCCGGVITDVSEKFDVIRPSVETYSSEELPETLGDHSLTVDSTEAERIAVLKTMFETLAEEKIDWNLYSVSVETEVRVMGSPKKFDYFVSAKECAEGAEVNYCFVFNRTISGYPTQAYYKAYTEADGSVWLVSVVSAVNLNRFCDVELDREALDAVVQRLGGANVTVSATLCTGAKSLYLVVDTAEEMGDGTMHVETIARKYFILVAEFVTE